VNLMKLVPFRCLKCDYKKPVFEDVRNLPIGAACIKNVCPDCLEKFGGMDDEYLNQDEYDLLLAKENPNQLSLL
jgi:hypothetical protein